MSRSSNIATLVDALGRIRAEITALTTKERELKEALFQIGIGFYEGDQFAVAVTCVERRNLDLVAVREKLPQSWLDQHTKVSEVWMCTVRARIEVTERDTAMLQAWAAPRGKAVRQ
jgi:hypothetical protein